MGYRSCVRFSTTNDGFDRFMQLIPDSVVPDLKTGMIVERDEHGVVFGWDWVKWYENCYEDVDAAMRAFNTLGDEGYAIEYARVGEDEGDVDERTHGDTDELYHRLGIKCVIYTW